MTRAGHGCGRRGVSDTLAMAQGVARPGGRALHQRWWTEMAILQPHVSALSCVAATFPHSIVCPLCWSRLMVMRFATPHLHSGTCPGGGGSNPRLPAFSRCIAMDNPPPCGYDALMMASESVLRRRARLSDQRRPEFTSLVRLCGGALWESIACLRGATGKAIWRNCVWRSTRPWAP